MKKHASFLALVAIALFMSTSSAHAQTESQRLYQEFLDALREQQQTPSTGSEMSPTQPAQPMTQPKVYTSDYSVSGKVTRTSDGRYLIATDEKPSRTLRVYGQDAAKEIMRAALYEKVQLIGKKAYFNGNLVGISAHQVVMLEGAPVPTKTVQPAPKPVVSKPMMVETTFTGTIEITAAGGPYLVMRNEKGQRVTHRLLNETNWKIAFQHAYKGTKTVRGYLNDKGAIRYSDIY